MFAWPWLTLAGCAAAGITLARLETGAGWLPWVLLAAAAGLLFAAWRARAEPAPALFCRSAGIARWRRGEVLAALALLLAAGGFARYRAFRESLRPGEDFVRENAGRTAPADLEILAPPESALGGALAGKWRAAAAVRGFAGRDCDGVNLQVYGTGRLDIRRGDRLRVPKLRVYPDRPPAFPGAFSYRALQRQAGLGGAARAVGGYEVIGFAEITDPAAPVQGGARAQSILQNIRGKIARAGLHVRRALDGLRARGVAAFTRLLPDARGAFLAAVVFGWVEGLPPEVTADFRYSGLGHVLAISGLHVGLVAALGWLLARLLFAGSRARAAAVLALVLFFVAVSGARASAVRAGTVAALYCGGILCLRRSDFLNALGLSALLILAETPETLFAVGFQFSYVAVLFIFCFGREYTGWRESARAVAEKEENPQTAAAALLPEKSFWMGKTGIWLKKSAAWLGGGAGVCLAAWLGTAPLVAYYFNLCSYGGLLANVASVPLLTLALVGGAGELLLSPWGGALPGWAADVLALPVEWMLALAARAGNWDAGWATVFSPPEWMLAVYYGLFLLFFSRRAFGFRAFPGKIYPWAVGLLLAGGGLYFYTFFSTFSGNSRPGVYALAARQDENFLVVAPGRRLSLVIQDARREWQEIQKLCLSLGFRKAETLVLAPGVAADAEFLRRIPCRRVIAVPETSARADGDAPAVWREALPGGAEVEIGSWNRGGYCWLQNGRAAVFSARAVSDSRLRDTGAAERAVGAACFLRKTPLRRFAGARVWYGADCPGTLGLSVTGGNFARRETCGAVYVDAETARAVAYGFGNAQTP